MACGGDSSGTGEAPPADTGDFDTGLADLGLETDTGQDTGGEDTTIVDSGADTEMPDTADTAMPDTEMPDTADTAPVDTGPPDTATCAIGGPCDDGNACTSGETFDTTCTCTGGTAISCDDSSVCTTDTCNPSTGCVHTPISCDDTNICTSDSCNPTIGCVHSATSEGVSCGAGKKCNSGICTELCTVGATCDDGNACTTGEKFDSTCACTGGTTLSCDDTNECTTDSCSTSTGCVNAPVADNTACGTSGSSNKCKAGVCTAPTAPPTISITTPTEAFVKTFNASSSACDGLPFTISVTAAAGIQTISWHLFTPTTDKPQMTGASCGAPTTALAPWHSGLGNPIYPFKIADSELTGKTSGTFTESIDVNGNYNSIAPWLFCTQPGTGGMAAATALDGTAIPAASTSPGAIRALANYCHSDNTTNDTGRQWTLLVRIVDKSGASATAERKFLVRDM